MAEREISILQDNGRAGAGLNDIADHLRGGLYDFIDFGCSNGDSIRFGFERLGARSGIGLDKDERKVEAAAVRGYTALQMDLSELRGFKDCVSFVLAFHFLEHLPGFRVAKSCVASAMSASRDFVMVKVPWFDSDGWLFRQGLKFFWSDWRGHDYAVSQLDLYRAIRDAGLPCAARFYGRRPVKSSSDLAIHPFDAPYDQHAYKPELHGAKTIIDFPDFLPTYYELQAIILLSERFRFEDLEQHLDGGQENLLFEAAFT